MKKRVDQILRLIAKLGSASDAYEISRAARERARDLAQEASERRSAVEERVWRKARNVSLGCWAVTSVKQERRMLVAPPGKRAAMFGLVQLPEMTILRVYAIQPRKKIAWLMNEATSEKYAMTPGDLAALDVRFYANELMTHVAIAAPSHAGSHEQRH